MRSLPAKPLWSFFLVAIPLYAALMVVPWPKVEDGYAALFQRVCGTVFRGIGPDGFTRFTGLDDAAAGLSPSQSKRLRAARDKDTAVELGSRRAPARRGYLRTSARLVGYYPTAFAAVLCLAAPIAFRRRLLTLLVTLILVQGFILLRVYVWLVVGFSDASKDYAQYHLSPFWDARLHELENVVHFNPTVSFIAPIAMWAIVLYAFGEVGRLVGQMAGTDRRSAGKAAGANAPSSGSRRSPTSRA